MSFIEEVSLEEVVKELDRRSSDPSLSIQDNVAYHTAAMLVRRVAQDIYYEVIR